MAEARGPYPPCIPAPDPARRARAARYRIPRVPIPSTFPRPRPAPGGPVQVDRFAVDQWALSRCPPGGRGRGPHDGTGRDYPTEAGTVYRPSAVRASLPFTGVTMEPPRFGDTRAEKAFVSQCAAEAPFGDSQRKLFCDFNKSILPIPIAAFRAPGGLG
jgi:hypothetical protein